MSCPLDNCEADGVCNPACVENALCGNDFVDCAAVLKDVEQDLLASFGMAVAVLVVVACCVCFCLIMGMVMMKLVCMAMGEKDTKVGVAIDYTKLNDQPAVSNA